jgi:hypothetical protein
MAQQHIEKHRDGDETQRETTLAVVMVSKLLLFLSSSEMYLRGVY